MKRIKNISLMAFFTVICVLGVFNSCTEEPQLKSLPYLFRPINFAATMNGTAVTLNWAKVDSAVNYTLQVSTDSVNFTNPVVNVTTSDLFYVKELAGNTIFFARIRANANDSTKNSKFNFSLTFKTPKENIFGGYTMAMSAMNTLDIKWLPKANVTHLVLTAKDNTTQTVTISSAEALAGEKNVASLSNSTYKVEIYNNTILRGTVNAVVEGDYYLNTGDDLPTTITNASAGQVIVLAPGGLFQTGSATYRFSQDIKVRGLLTTNLPVICMTSATSTSSMLGFVDGSTMNSVKFENIDFTGYAGNTTAGTKIGYLFNNNVMTTVKSLSFRNCNLHNFGNTPMRLQGGKNQVVDTLSFNGCVINDIGFSSTYAVVNSNSADFFNTINFTNCTVYNFKGSLVLRTGQTLNSINVTNCTINQGMQDAGTARYLIDTNNATFNGSGGINIKNCVLGSTGAAAGANGIRNTTGTVTITGSYYTSDYVDDPIPLGLTSSSIKSKMTSYSGTSTALWNGPTTGDFTLKDTGFAGKGSAGDIRWY